MLTEKFDAYGEVLRVIGGVGGRVTAAVTLSLLFLLALSICLVWYGALA